jgi:hypothetical protein
MMALLDEAASRSLAGEDVRLRPGILLEDAERAAAAAGLDSGTTDAELALLATLPDLRLGPAEEPEEVFRTSLHRTSGMLWPKVEVPWEGPALFAAQGLFAIIEQTASAAAYEEVTVPAMAGVRALTRWYFHTDDEEPWQSGESMVALDRMVTQVAMEPDPLSALERLDEDLPGG